MIINDKKFMIHSFWSYLPLALDVLSRVLEMVDEAFIKKENDNYEIYCPQPEGR